MILREAATALAMATLATLATVSLAAEPADRSYTFELRTPPVEALAHEAGFAEIRIRGFDRRDAPAGAPDVPVRTVLVAIPPGATPRLALRLSGSRGFRAWIPRPAPRVFYDLGAEDLAADPSVDVAERRLRFAYEPAAERYAGQGTYPARVAWLGQIGVLRNQRYVEVHLAPVRYDLESRRLVVDEAVEVTVHFDGAGDPTGSPAAADRFESVYREAFANYAQGRQFRLDGEAAAAEAPVESRQATRNAAGPVRRLRVRENGPLRLDHGLLSLLAPEFLASDPRTWRLVNRGQAVPLHLRQLPGNDGALEPGEWVQVFGQALDDEPQTELSYEKPANPAENLYAARDFTDENAYFLTIEAGQQPAMTERDATPPPSGVPAASFTATAHVEVDSPSLFFPLPEELLFWTPFTNESSAARTEVVPLPGLVSGTLPIQVRLGVRGFLDCAAIDPDHKTLVALKNGSGSTLILPASNPDNVGNQNVGEFDGNRVFVHDFGWTHSGSNPQVTNPLQVILSAANMPGTCPSPSLPLKNDNLLDFIEVDYARSFTAVADELTFDYADGNTLFEIAGLTGGPVDVYEVTGQIAGSGVVDAVRLTGVEVVPAGPSFKARFRVLEDPQLPNGTPRRFVVVGPAGAQTPVAADFEPDRESTLVSDTTQADLVVIAHPDLVASECSAGGNPCAYDADCTASDSDRCEIVGGSALDLLLARRAAQGITSRVARLQDIDDEFNFGLSGPSSIARFLEWVAAGGWDPPLPAYVLLVGDGSWDSKNGSGNFVPTQIMVKAGKASSASILPHYSSDNLLAAVVGDDPLADMAVGRLSARSLAEAETILSKIRDQEALPAAGAWNRSVLFISDRGKQYDAGEALGFEAMNDIGAAFLSGTPYAVSKLRYWTDNCGGTAAGCDSNEMTQDIKNRINGIVGPGVAMAQFAGHGNFDLWSDDVIFCANEQNTFCSEDDTQDLFNFNKLPWLIVHNCLTGGFHSLATKSFGEQWLKRPSGGAFGVFAPSGLGFQFIGTVVTEVLWNSVFGPHKERVLGVPVMNGLTQLCTQGSIESCHFYTLLGDPSSRLALPDVGAPRNVVATPSTGLAAFVGLSWDPSSTAGATYDVYRTTQLDQPYQKINCSPIGSNNCSPIAGPSYTDASVTRTQVYFYYVVAVNGGFESAWSNFNTDCGESPGPDCVQAKPLNLTPPAVPTLLAAEDSEKGGSLLVSWLPNPEPDLANYTVHFGTTPALGQTLTVFNSSTQVLLTGLQNGTTYFIALQAKNTSGASSAVSAPLSAEPTLVLGVKSPRFIGDLRLSKSGSHALLTWGPVTQDIYGKPKTISHYEVFRGTSPLFVPSPANRVGTPAAPAFTDLGALAPGGPNYHYLVRAIDTQGNPGGAGHQLPAGIMNLVLQRTPSSLVLDWPDVTLDFDGNPTQISHYQVWSDTVPVSRSAIEAGLADLVVPAAPGSTAQIVLVPENRYYSVLAVDTRGNRSPF